jgi:hexulose-6-phosphate isomerase
MKREIHKAIMLSHAPGGGSVAEKFNRIKAAGFAGVEVKSGMARDEVLKTRDANELQIPSVYCADLWNKPLSDPNASVRAEGLSALKAALNDAKSYGASSVLTIPAVVNGQVSYEDAYKRSQDEIRKAIPVAEGLGVKIAFENVWNRFLLSPLEAVRYIEEFNSPAVGWHFDVGNIIPYGWPEQWIGALGKRIQKLHIKEYSREKLNKGGPRKGFDVEYLEGDNDWPAVMKAVDEIGYRGWAIAEPEFYPKGVPPAERLQQISEKMDKILAM